MIVNKSKKISRRKGKSFSNKKTTIIMMSTTLVAMLIFSNVAVSSKTYALINCTKELDSLKAEFKDLNEQKEVLISPIRIREKAMNDLGMADIENIDELLVIQP